MSIVRCHQCRLPVTADEARPATQPRCQVPLTPDTTPATRTGPPATVRAGFRVVVGMAILAAGLAAYAPARQAPAAGQTKTEAKPPKKDSPQATKAEAAAPTGE